MTVLSHPKYIDYLNIILKIEGQFRNIVQLSVYRNYCLKESTANPNSRSLHNRHHINSPLSVTFKGCLF